MAKIAWKPGTMMAPLPPALISCGTLEKPNVMTAAWTGIVCTEPTLVYVSIRPSRYSNELIRQSGEFVINVPTVELAKAVDLCGVKSGRDTDNFKLAGITASPCEKIGAPQVAEAPVSLECKVKEITSLGSHDVFLAEVVAVDVDEKYINSKQALDLEKAGLLAYAHGFYYALGRKIGKFGWSVEKKSTKRKRAANKNSARRKTAVK
jgi:flavin reductase (DIM6/NTAB) family NADH-FMN oxidoreductase RutF